MSAPELIHVVPNEQWQPVLQFAPNEYRLFDASIARMEHGWAEFAYPNKLKNLTFARDQISWPAGRTLSASYLYKKSRPISGHALENQVLRLGYQNQAPTPQHQSHHVYGVYLAPFKAKCFVVGESIGGGHAEMGGSRDYSLAELLAWPEWRYHFNLSGCDWALPLIEAGAHDEHALLCAFVKELCRREGTTGT